MTNEQLSEYYGFKAHDHGFFEQWREQSAQYMLKNPKADRSDVYGKIFIELLDKKNQEPSKRVASV